MINMMRAGFVAAVVCAALSGCTGAASGLTNAIASTVAATTGGTSGGVSSGGTTSTGEACPTTAPAAAPTTGTPSEGAYSGLTLPNGWDTQYTDQAGVDGGFTSLKTTNPTAWVTAQCIYRPAIAVWAKNTNQTP